MVTSEFQQTISFEPGPAGMGIRFLLKGEHGAMQFLCRCGVDLPRRIDSGVSMYGVDLGYHSLQPTFEGETVFEERCEHLDGRPCHYDGSSLVAADVMERFARDGEEAVWAVLRAEYARRFQTEAAL
jgi:hypothetical protein